MRSEVELLANVCHIDCTELNKIPEYNGEILLKVTNYILDRILNNEFTNDNLTKNASFAIHLPNKSWYDNLDPHDIKCNNNWRYLYDNISETYVDSGSVGIDENGKYCVIWYLNMENIHNAQLYNNIIDEK